LTAVSARDVERISSIVGMFRDRPRIAPLSELAGLADVVIECAPSSVYDQVARPAIEAGLVFITMSSGALLARPDLFARAKDTGARIIVPSGGVLGFDGLAGAAEGDIQSVILITRKPPKSFAGAPYLEQNGISVSGLIAPLSIFKGTAREAALAFPANANVAASLCLAGIGPERTLVEMWADPGIASINQEVRVRSDSCAFTIAIESCPLADNPRTGSLTPKSLIAALRSLTAPVRIGT
jgi:aspartate dehydrogenase